MFDFLLKIFIKDYDKTENKDVRSKYGIFSSIVGVICNVILAGIKLLAGILSGSIAIIADAINNISDAGSAVVSFVSFKIASKPADRDHPFGHARIEYVASLIVSFLILSVGFDFFTDSAKKIFNPSLIERVDVTAVTIIILSASIFIKLWLGLFYSVIGKKINSSVIKASALDSLSDCISTAAVLACSVIILLTDLVIVDAIVGLAVSVMILVAGIRILNETKNSILGEAPVDETVAEIKRIVGEYPEIIDIHDLMVHNYGPSNYIASFHAEVNGEDDIYVLHDTIDNVERRIGNDLGILCTIHLDPIAINDETVQHYKQIAIDAAGRIDPKISVHDFRVVTGNTHTNLIFDIVLPFESKLSEKEASELLTSEIQSIEENLFCVITVDRG
ncbi:MAG: cation transporter [Ruminococcaceae bacterium]|nr:cation transporter [Oscillospiraceae bacterium]